MVGTQITIISMASTNLKDFTIYDSYTGQSRELSRIGIDVPVDYLNELDHKPYINIPKFCDTEEGFQLAKSIIHSNIPPSTASGIVVSFIAKVMESITGILQDDWKSYSVIIGHKGDTISPLSLLNIKKTELEFSGVKPDTTAAVTDYAIAAKALKVYRIAQAPAAQMGYKAELVRRIGEVFKMEPFNLDSTAGGDERTTLDSRPRLLYLSVSNRYVLQKIPESQIRKVSSMHSGRIFERLRSDNIFESSSAMPFY
ncbi:Rhabdovirus nucleocapsid family protein [Brugia pahangi]